MAIDNLYVLYMDFDSAGEKPATMTAFIGDQWVDMWWGWPDMNDVSKFPHEWVGEVAGQQGIVARRMNAAPLAEFGNKRPDPRDPDFANFDWTTIQLDF